MSFRLANVRGRAALIADESYHDLATIAGRPELADPMAAIAEHRTLHDLDAGLGDLEPAGELSGEDLGPPVPGPRSCFAVGLNYRSHADEAGAELPDVPLVFSKFPTCLVGPEADIELGCQSADHEAELVVAIGTGGRNISAAGAWSHVAGLTVGQDISDRALQFAAKPPHFDLGKSRDTYGPIGPVLVSTDAVADRDDLAIRCEVNGVVRQDGTTAKLVFGVPELIAYLSSILTLNPGDLIFTGTPDGVGAVEGRFLAPGDVVTTTIEGIGTLRNTCR